MPPQMSETTPVSVSKPESAPTYVPPPAVKTPAATSAGSPADFKNAIQKEPVIQVLMDMFAGELLPK